MVNSNCNNTNAGKSRRQWVFTPQEKADVLAETFMKKYSLEDEQTNEYSITGGAPQSNAFEVETLKIADAASVLSKLSEDSATGPDMLPARILRKMSHVLAMPLLLLAQTILSAGRWPECWLEHWVVPLFKKKAVFNPQNYRGVHLSAQLSKAVERLIGLLWVPRVSADMFIGANQFAYRKLRGSRDALALIVLSWLDGFRKKSRFAMYLSDVSGAFDRVSSAKLIQKMRAKGIPETIISVVASWLRGRKAHVVVGGKKSCLMELLNQVYQGTVWGPTLWNLFFEDSDKAIHRAGFTEVKFADDLNAYKEFASGASDEVLLGAIGACQLELHQWGKANQVSFDAGKEGKCILSRTRPVGNGFTLLGVDFDCKLIMDQAIQSLLAKCRWKLRSLLRCQRHFDARNLVNLYKSRLLGYIEYRTAAIYHACDSLLHGVDNVQNRILEHLRISETQALFDFNLAPLGTRRDIAMLGLVHRAVLGTGPPQFSKFFKRVEGAPDASWRHKLQLVETEADVTDFMYPSSSGKPADYVVRSALGLCAVYNLLPAGVVECSPTVAGFQSALQEMLKSQAAKGCSGWNRLFSPRWDIKLHPLRTAV